MNLERSPQPPLGITPHDEDISPQVGTSTLIDTALVGQSPQIGSTILIDTALTGNEHPQTGTSVLGESVLNTAGLPKTAPPKTSMLGEGMLGASASPQKSSVLPQDLFPTIPPPKLPKLVKDKPKKEKN